MTLLRFDGVGKTYPGGHRALDDLSFSVQAGEMVFVTGHSGAGKSTLLKLAHLIAAQRLVGLALVFALLEVQRPVLLIRSAARKSGRDQHTDGENCCQPLPNHVPAPIRSRR